MLKRILLGIGILFVSSTIQAQQTIYRWRDAQGVMVYSDRPPTSDVRDVKIIKSTSGNTIRPFQNANSGGQLGNQVTNQSDVARVGRGGTWTPSGAAMAGGGKSGGGSGRVAAAGGGTESGRGSSGTATASGNATSISSGTTTTGTVATSTPSNVATTSGSDTSAPSGVTPSGGSSAPTESSVATSSSATLTPSSGTTTSAGMTTAASGVKVSTLAPEPQAIPSTLFGMHFMCNGWNGNTCVNLNWPTVQIGAQGKSSCTSWHYIQQSRGLYNWATLDQYVNLAVTHDIDYMYTFKGVPAWALSNHSSCFTSGCSQSIQECNAIPDKFSDWTDFVTALVRRYKGKIKYYELYNEPYQTALSPSDLATLTKAAYSIIRAIDPDAKIITPSMYGGARDYAQQYFQAGGPTGVDIASFHAYPSGTTSNVPEAIMPDRYLFSYILPTINTYLAGKPIWDTEGAIATTVPNDFDQQAAFIARWYLLHWSSGISRMYWYQWDDHIPLMPSNIGSTLPATAYQQVENWMVGATMPSACVPSGPTTSYFPNGTTFSCTLTRPGGYQALAVWNVNGSLSYTPASSVYTQYKDLAGNITKVTPGSDITIGIKPILLENGDSTPHTQL